MTLESQASMLDFLFLLWYNIYRNMKEVLYGIKY